MSENFYGRMNPATPECDFSTSIPQIAPSPPTLSKALPSQVPVEVRRPPTVLLVTDLDLRDVRVAWGDFQSNRARDAIYDYLKRVFELVLGWKGRGEINGRIARLVKTFGLSSTVKAEPFSVVIYCTSDPKIVDAKTRSKWSRVLRYVQRFKDERMGFKTFVRRKRGINACASRFAARLGRGRL
jgi:hypothetical protein